VRRSISTRLGYGGFTMIVEIPSSPGTPWHVESGAKKLQLRAQLPGALVFDFAAESLRAAREAGVSAEDRLFLALPGSWLVNSPAVSRVLRRWALPPDRAAWLALLAVLGRGPDEWMAKRAESRVALRDAVEALGAEPTLVEAVSKVAALLVPDLVPLMPQSARTFVLGDEVPSSAGAFVAMVDWFVGATTSHRDALGAIAAGHLDAKLSGAGVLDRLLWFDSEGHQHFPEIDASNDT
jgi:hypothetical protein